MELRSALTGRTDQHDSEARVERHRDQSRLAVPRYTFNSDVLRIDCFIRFEVIQAARSAPGPRAESAPVIRLAGLGLVHQPDDALGQTGPIVRLDASWIDGDHGPSIRDELFDRRRIATQRRTAWAAAARRSCSKSADWERRCG